MTTYDNISAIEAVEKAMEGVTQGDWYLAGKLTIRHTSVVGGSDGWIGKVNWRNGEANAAYIAACNPVALSTILAEARKAEAMKGEIAGKDARIAALEAERRMIVSHATMGNTDGDGMSVNSISVQITRLRNELIKDSRARTLLNGGSNASI